MRSSVIADPGLSLGEGVIPMWSSNRMRYYHRLLTGLGEVFGFSMDTAWKDLPEDIQQKILYGTGQDKITIKYTNRFGESDSGRPPSKVPSRSSIVVTSRPRVSRLGSTTRSTWRRSPVRRAAAAGSTRSPSPSPLPIATSPRSPTSLSARPRSSSRISLSDRERAIAERVLKEVKARIQFLLDVGLDYLSLSRSAATLAGGEAQRIRLATQIGSGLVGVLYILDEPSIGLHQRDNQRLIETLLRLRDLGNTLIVVEHDEDTIRVADHIVDIGPGAGEHGGHVVAEGTLGQHHRRA